MKLLISMTAMLMLVEPVVMTSASQNAFPVIPVVRRAPEGRPADPSPLPAAADRVVPLTLDVRIHRQVKARRREDWRQTVHRTADRIHVSGAGGEWLFERNVRDGSRVSGSLIDHDSRTIVVYEESDLRNAVGIAGWASVLALGLDPGWVESLVPTRETRIVNGIRAVRHTPLHRRGNPSEVWWAGDEALPVAFTIADGTAITRLSVERVSAGADAALLGPPALRFPHYAVVQFADWLERH